MSKNKKKEIITIKIPAAFTIHGYIADVQGCGTIRMMFPYMLLNQFKREGLKFSAFYNPNFILSPQFYKDLTFVVFQRSITDSQLKIFEYFDKEIKGQTKTPLIYEIDDLLVDIPETNYAADYYKSYSGNIPKFMRLSDGLIVSTERLKQVYKKYNTNIQVSPNRLPKFLWGDIKTNFDKENEKTRILWAGSGNHFAIKKLIEKGINGGDFSEELINFIRKTADIYQWVFLGAMPHELDDITDKVEFHKWRSIFEYPSFLKSLNIDFCIAPLKKNLFNECKSNIKMLEYTAAGFPGIYSNCDPYKGANLLCDSDEEMISYIVEMTVDKDLRKNVYEHDYNMLKGDIFWEENNNLLKFVNAHLLLFDRKIDIGG